MLKLFYLILILFLFQPLITAGVSFDVVINEIAWMGTDVSANDEWIELYNNSDKEINLDGWVLRTDDGVPEINLTGQISAQGFYLLERTDDNTVPEIAADLIYKGALGNNGENLKLFDNLGNLIDQANFGDGWPAGDNGAKLTMEKADSGWQNSQGPGGTPKTPNSQLPEETGGAKLLEETNDEEKVEAGPRLSYPGGIVFTKIMPSPEGPDAEEEWIEIYNSNNFEVDLSGWQIKDTAGKNTTYTLDNKIKELSSFRLSRPETKIILNNDGDGLELLNPQGEVVDSMSFEKALQGQSYIKTSSGWSWEGSLAPLKTSTKASEETKGAKLQEQSSPAQYQGAKLLDIGLKEKNRSLVPMFIAVIVALISAAIVLVIKNFTKMT